MTYVKINGISFDVNVAISKLNRNFNVLDGDNSGRTTSGLMIRDVIGTYIGHKVTFFRKGNNYAALDQLWDYLILHSVDDSVMLEVADGQSSISYRAYYTSGSQDIEIVTDGVNYWDEFEISFVPMMAQKTP